jgi:hypothetical protein
MTQVLPTSIRQGDVVRLDNYDGTATDYRVVSHIYTSERWVGLNLYPTDVEPGRTIADLVWFPRSECCERVKCGPLTSRKRYQVEGVK